MHLSSVWGKVGDVAVRTRTLGFLRCHSDWDCLPTKCTWELLIIPARFWKRRGELVGGLTDGGLVVLVSQHAVACGVFAGSAPLLFLGSPQALTHLSNYGVQIFVPLVFKEHF